MIEDNITETRRIVVVQLGLLQSQLCNMKTVGPMAKLKDQHKYYDICGTHVSKYVVLSSLNCVIDQGIEE